MRTIGHGKSRSIMSDCPTLRKLERRFIRAMDVINQPMLTDAKLTKLVTMEQLVRAVREDVGEQGEGEHKTNGWNISFQNVLPKSGNLIKTPAISLFLNVLSSDGAGR